MMKGNRSFVFFLCVVLGMSFPAFSQKGRIYISPNNDGVQDQLEVPLSITDKRYIKEWQFIVENQSNDVVRRIGNKISHPEKITVKNFFSRLFSEKKGVDVPDTVIWDGSLDSGEIASDFFRLLPFNERPHTFRSLVCTSLTSFCSYTLLAGYRSSVRYLLSYFGYLRQPLLHPTSRRWHSQPFGVSSPCSVFCIEVMRIMLVNLLFSYFPPISFCGYALRVFLFSFGF